MDLSEPPTKSFIQEKKTKYSHFRKQDQSHLAATCKHSLYTRKKNRRYAQRTVVTQVILFFHYLIWFLLTLQIHVWYYSEDRKGSSHALSNHSVSATEWSSIHWSHCSQGVLRASLMPPGQGAGWDAVSSLQLIYPHAGIPKSCFPFQKKGRRKNIARRTYFMESRISRVKERNSIKCLII